ncbi:MAG: beta-propeller fold lactonase family protein [Clostridia bacterium]
MQERVIVSDATGGCLTAYRLPTWTIQAQTRELAQPSSLCGRDGWIYCACMADACIWRLRGDNLQPVQCYAAGKGIEHICLSRDGRRLYALLGEADSLLMLDVDAGYPLMSTPVGVHPRDMRLDHSGRWLAVAGGASGSILMLEADTLRVRAEYAVDGIACGVLFGREEMLALCASGDYELHTVIGGIRPHQGLWHERFTLPGLPGAFAMSAQGLYVGHLGGIALFQERNGTVIWKLTLRGLPDQLLPIGHQLCFADRLEGRLGILDATQPQLLRTLRQGEPAGLLLV